MRRLVIPVLVLIVLAATTPAVGGHYESVPVSDVVWEQLNPARGDKSPKAGTLWGDRNGDGPTGFLVEFGDGFSSPPHIHNVSYRGVVISGLVHNDDPAAAPMWMPAGSFWTQPQGEAHITAAQGELNRAYIEIEAGPYLVHPDQQAFDNGERPVNVDASNIVWLDLPGANGLQIAHLWGTPRAGELHGSLVALPDGFDGVLRGEGDSLKAVVIQGALQHGTPGETGSMNLAAGSYFGSTGVAEHHVTSAPDVRTVIYVRAEGMFEILAGE